MQSTPQTELHDHCVLCGSEQVRELVDYRKHQMLKCLDCGMVFMARIPSLEELNKHYAQYAYSGERWISPITIKRYHELLDRMEVYRGKEGGRILDVGCGMGHFLLAARERGWDVWGSEYSQAAVAHCESKGIRMHLGAHAPEAFPEGYFDVITSFEVLEHLQDPLRDTQIVSSWLRQGGLFYATTPNWNAWHRRKFKADYDVICYPEHLMYFTRKTIRQLAKKSELKVLKTETTGINFTRVARSRDRENSIIMGSKHAPTELMRAKTEQHWFWSGVKNITNRILSITGTGSTLKIWSEKE